MIFSWTITVGTVIEVVTIFIGVLAFVWGTKARIEAMSAELLAFNTELGALKTEISKLADILTKVAVQDQRILAVEKDIDELRHGIGFIVNPSSPGLPAR